MSQSGSLNNGSSSSGGVLEFTGGTGTSGTFPVSPNGFGQVSLSSSNGTVSIVGSASSIDLSTSSGLLNATGTLTSLQIKSLFATPVLAIAAPGAGKVIVILKVSAKLNYGGSNVFIAGLNQGILLYYGNSSFNFSATTVLCQDTFISANVTSFTTGNITTLDSANSNYDNKALYFGNPISTEISGNAANNNTVTYSILYQIVSI